MATTNVESGEKTTRVAKEQQELPSSEDRLEKFYHVEKLLDRRTDKDGTVEYLVKWVGYGPEENSWEPVNGLHCPEILKAFNEAHAVIGMDSVMHDSVDGTATSKRGRKPKKRARKGGKKKKGGKEAEENSDDSIPCVLKEKYILDEAVMPEYLLGVRRLDANCVMAFMTYTDGRAEFLPTEKLDEYDLTAKMLREYYEQRLQFFS